MNLKLITKQEVWYLERVDDSIVSAAIRVEPTRLRRYLRNWITELNRQKKEQTPYIRPPKKK